MTRQYNAREANAMQCKSGEGRVHDELLLECAAEVTLSHVDI